MLTNLWIDHPVGITDHILDAVMESAVQATIVLPAYNEEANLPGLFKRLQAALEPSGLTFHVLVIDDGSTDRTRSIAQNWSTQLPITIHSHAVNQGLGATLRDGLNMAVARSGDVIVTMDADETHDPELIPVMARMAASGKDVVIASRYQPGSRVDGVPPFRRALSLGASLLLRVLFPIAGVRDYTSGFRAYRADSLKVALARFGERLVSERGFDCMAGLLLTLRRIRLQFCEVPITLRYNLKQGPSKLKIFHTISSTLMMILRRRLAG